MTGEEKIWIGLFKRIKIKDLLANCVDIEFGKKLEKNQKVMNFRLKELENKNDNRK
jgi:hypothetical protein